MTGDTASTNSYAGSCEKFTLTKDTRTTDEYNLKGMCNNRPYLSVGHDNKVGTYGSAGHCERFKLQKSGNEYGLRAACGGKHYVKVEHTGVAMTYATLGHCERFTIGWDGKAAADKAAAAEKAAADKIAADKAVRGQLWDFFRGFHVALLFFTRMRINLKILRSMIKEVVHVETD